MDHISVSLNPTCTSCLDIITGILWITISSHLRFVAIICHLATAARWLCKICEVVAYDRINKFLEINRIPTGGLEQCLYYTALTILIEGLINAYLYDVSRDLEMFVYILLCRVFVGHWNDQCDKLSCEYSGPRCRCMFLLSLVVHGQPMERNFVFAILYVFFVP